MAIEVIKVTEEDITVTLTDVGIRGRAGLVFRGDWSSVTQYYQGDAVRFDNNVYIATGTPIIATEPTEADGTVNANWALLVNGSPTLDNIVDFYEQPGTGDSSSISIKEGDLVKSLTGRFFWVLSTEALTSSTDTSDLTKFEPRGFAPNIVTNAAEDTATAGIQIGDVQIATDTGDSFVWSGTAWLELTTRPVSATESGLMSSADFNKLADVEADAEANDQVTVAFSGNTITVTSTADKVTGRTDDATIPDTDNATKGLVQVDGTTITAVGGVITANGNIELDQLSDVDAPIIAESGFVLQGFNDGVNATYGWVDNNDQVESIRRWDEDGTTDYLDQTVGTAAVLGLVTGTFNNGANNFTLTERADGTWLDANDSPSINDAVRTLAYVVDLVDNTPAGVAIVTENLAARVNRVDGGSSIVEFNERLYIALMDIDHNAVESGSCNVAGTVVSGVTRSNCIDVRSGTWTPTNPDVDSRWNEIGPSLLENLDDVDLTVSEGTWEAADNPILARVGTEWRLFPGLDSLANIGDIPAPTTDQAGFVLTTDGAADPTFTWNDQVARVQDFSVSSGYQAGDLVRVIGTGGTVAQNLAASQIFLAISPNTITASTTLPTDGGEWQNVGPSSLSDLQDTTFSTPVQGNVLTFDQGAWRNLTANAAIAAAIDLTEIGDVPGNSIADKVLVSTGTVVAGQRYTWEDYGRNVKNIQPYDSATTYLGGDLVQYQGDIYISLNTTSATAPVPNGTTTDANWNQIGASGLLQIDDVPAPTADGQVLGFSGNDSVTGDPTFTWTTEIDTAARVPAFSTEKDYQEGALVTVGTGTSLAVFISLKTVNASTTVPTDDGLNWEIIGPERMENLEDASVASAITKDLLQYDVDTWRNVTPATVAADMNLSNIGDVTAPVSGTDNNKVLRAVFDSVGDVTYSWIDRTTDTATIQSWNGTAAPIPTYLVGNIVYHQDALYLAIDDNDATTTNISKEPGTSAGKAFWQLIGPESFEELEDWVAGNPALGTGNLIAFDADATANDGTTGAWKPIAFFDASNVGDILGVNITRDSNGNISAKVDASAYPTLTDFQDKTTSGDTLGVNFIETSGVITADIDASGYTQPGDFTDTSNTGDTLGVNFTGVNDSVTATVDASAYPKTSDFNDTANSGDTLGVDFTVAPDGDITGTVDASAYPKTADFNDTANSGDTLGVDFTVATDGDITATVDASSYPTVSDFQDKSNSGDTLGVNFINTSGVITADIDASDYPKTGDFNDTANSGDTLGVNFTVATDGDITGTVDATTYTQPGDFKDTVTSGDTLGVDFTGANDSVTATVDASAYPTLTDFHDKSNSGDTLGVNFINTSGVITADIDASAYPKTADFNDTANSGDNLGVNFTVDSGGDISGIIDASDYPKTADFNDTANSGDTLGVNFTVATNGEITGTVDSSAYTKPGDFTDTANTNDELGVNFTSTADSVVATVDASAYPKTTDFNDTANSGDSLGINFTVDSGGDIFGSVDASSYTQPGDFTDTANSGDALGVNFTGADDSVTATVDASAYTQPGDFKASTPSTDEIAVEFTTATDSVTAVVDLQTYTPTASFTLETLSDVDAPNSDGTEDGFVLKGNRTSGATPSYTWATLEDPIATIQDYTSTKSYNIGELVRHDSAIYLALKANSPNDNDPATPETQVTPGTDETTWETVGPESIGRLTGVNEGSVTRTAGDLLARTGTGDTWVNITPANMAENGIDFTDLKDIDIATANNIIVKRNADNSAWEALTPAAIAEAGIDLTDLKDIDDTSINNGDMLYRATDGSWQFVTLKSITDDVTHGVALEELHNVADTVATDSFLQKGSSGYEAKTVAQVGAQIDVQNLKDVDGSAPSDNEVLQYDSADSQYKTVDTDEVLKTGHLENLDRVPSDPDLTRGDTSDIGKVLTIRKVTLGAKTDREVAFSVTTAAAGAIAVSIDGTSVATATTTTTSTAASVVDSLVSSFSATGFTIVDGGDSIIITKTDGTEFTVTVSEGASGFTSVITLHIPGDDKPNYTWEAPRQASIQTFVAGSTSEPVTYAVGDLVFTNDTNGQRIWIAQRSLDSVSSPSNIDSVGDELLFPPGKNGDAWNLVGPESFDQLEDASISGQSEGEILRYDNDSSTWKNVGFISPTLGTDELAVSISSVDAGVSAKLDTSTLANKTGTYSRTVSDSRFLREGTNWDGNVAYVTNDIVTVSGALFRAVIDAGTAFDDSATYNPDDVVSSEGTLFSFNSTTSANPDAPGTDSRWVSFTKLASESPDLDTDSSDWIKFMQTGDEGVPAYRDNVTYASNDLVSFNGDIYRAGTTAPTSGDDPSDDATNWQRLGVTFTDTVSKTTDGSTTDKTQIGVNFDYVNSTGVVTAVADLSFDDTANSAGTLGVNYTNTAGVVTSTVNATGYNDVTIYTTGRDYSVGDIVWYNTAGNRGLFRNTTAVSSAPAALVATSWMFLESVPKFSDRNRAAFAIGDLINHSGKVYRAIAAIAASASDHTAPSSDTTNWRDISVNNLSQGILSSNTRSSVSVDVVSDTIGANARLTAATSTLAGVMTAADKLHIDATPPIWVITTDYVAGDEVLFSGRIYVSLLGVINNNDNDVPNVGNQPDTSTLYWQDNAIKRPEDWNGRRAYAQNNLVTFNGSIYRFLRTPLFNVWVSGQVFASGVTVNAGGLLYEARRNTTASDTDDPLTDIANSGTAWMARTITTTPALSVADTTSNAINTWAKLLETGDEPVSTYDDSITYAVNDFVLFSGNMYRLNSLIASGQDPVANTAWELISTPVIANDTTGTAGAVISSLTISGTRHLIESASGSGISKFLLSDPAVTQLLPGTVKMTVNRVGNLKQFESTDLTYNQNKYNSDVGNNNNNHRMRWSNAHSKTSSSGLENNNNAFTRFEVFYCANDNVTVPQTVQSIVDEISHNEPVNFHNGGSVVQTNLVWKWNATLDPLDPNSFHLQSGNTLSLAATPSTYTDGPGGDVPWNMTYTNVAAETATRAGAKTYNIGDVVVDTVINQLFICLNTYTAGSSNSNSDAERLPPRHNPVNWRLLV